MKVGISIGILLIFGVSLVACKQITKATDVITNPTARELYAREFKNDSIHFPVWEKMFENALLDSLEITLPYEEKGTYRENNMVAYSFNVALQAGEVFHSEVFMDTLTSRVFMDLFIKKSDSLQEFESVTRNEYRSKSMLYTVEKSGTYKIVVQPEIDASTPFYLKLYRTPLYWFPVSGMDNKAVQSFWGAPRGDGSRIHKGIDIFAKKGTPVIAATDGRIGFTGNRGLGGKQVWLRSGMFGNSLYYAHLDSIVIVSGKRVNAGDTLGFVGNTGNARSTKPHLHFGIYRGYRGAVDPYPFVKINKFPKAKSNPSLYYFDKGLIKTARANLRLSPYIKSEKVGEAYLKDSLMLLGDTGDWFHIVTKDSINAFVHKSLVSPLSNPPNVR